MATKVGARSAFLEKDVIAFSIEGRIVRELGERLVKEPEVALLELIKNAFDADAKSCSVAYDYPDTIVVSDTGHGMTIAEFRNGWMRIGTSAKEESPRSQRFGRTITGEKGIGRFAVRYLGSALSLKSVAMDREHGMTVVEAVFNWPDFDKHEDLGKVTVPYTLRKADPAEAEGTTLTISQLRQPAKLIDLGKVRTAALSNLSPYQVLLDQAPQDFKRSQPKGEEQDPGFSLSITIGEEGGEDAPTNVADLVLQHFVLRCVVQLKGKTLSVTVYEYGKEKPRLSIVDQVPKNLIGPLYGDIRFYPRRKGVLQSIGVDGRVAQTWLKNNSGVAVFDRAFRVYPYGTEGDDWLLLEADRSRSARDPRSPLALKHFPMGKSEHGAPSLNYMLRLPYTQQLVGVLRVEGRRIADQTDADGLVATADREGFVNNEAYSQLFDIVRGAIEAIAHIDRRVAQEEEKREIQRLRQEARAATRAAIREIESNPRLTVAERNRIVRKLVETEQRVTESEEASTAREAALEVMSLLGVVAGFMTHEFGMAIHALEESIRELKAAAKTAPAVAHHAKKLEKHLADLQEFVDYSQGYIKGVSIGVPEKSYPVKPRIASAIRVFGKYADERHIQVATDIDADLPAPLVPVSLYNGIVLNLFTNAIKAISARVGKEERRISFRAWNQGNKHILTVSDTGIGIPLALRKRVFDPLFSTTESSRDPLGSGMGLGLTLVNRCVEAFGGRVSVVAAPPGFTTCFRIELPLKEDS
jgi:signal transduction histidine kinase